MKEKNKKMIIIVISLLLVVGVSLAYFTASVLLGGDGTSVTGSTTTIQDSTLIVEGTLEFNDLDIYPGHESVSSIRVTATGNNELIPYNVIWKGTNTLNTPLNYTVYKTSNEIEVSSSCSDKTGVIDGARIYYEECTITNLESLGSPITEGTITTSDVGTTIELIGDEFINSSPTGEEVYYYVILEYPNLDESQNIDMGGTFNGEITIEKSDAQPDFNLIAVMVEKDDEDYVYDYSDTVPASGYRLDYGRSSCQVNGAEAVGINMTYANGELTVDGLTQAGTVCTAYFIKSYRTGNPSEVILAGKDQLTRTDFSTAVTDTTTGTIYYADTNAGRTYYFAGNPTDNWVQFAGFYWRIIRINEDGSVRMIYNGTSTTTTGSTTLLRGGTFGSSSTNNMYVGYMYENGQVHGLINDSTIKGVLDTWYENNLERNYAQYLSTEAGFCGDREPSTSSSSRNGSGGTGTTNTYYGAYIRLATNKTPTFDCQNDSDLYTVASSSQGNKALGYPIGFITADEVAFAGGVYGTENQSYYLYTNSNYWTMSPFYFNSGHAYVFVVRSNGDINYWGVFSSSYVRPVINLSADVTITGGIGTTTDPYVVS